MMKTLILTVIIAIITISCSSNRAFTDGDYEDPKSITLLDDRFNEADVQKIATKMVETLSQCSQYEPKRSKVVLGEIANNTTEHIDLDMILFKIKTALLQNNKFQFID